MKSGLGWSAEQDAQLRALWDEGYTASQIATYIGDKTRNAIIGRSHRLKLSARPHPVRDRALRLPTYGAGDEARERRNASQRALMARKRDAAREAKTAQPAAQKLATALARITPKPPRPMAVVATQMVGKMTLAECQDVRGCRYAFGDLPAMTFCGNVPADPWCSTHKRLVYRPAMGAE